jgi:hypothetical protein
MRQTWSKKLLILLVIIGLSNLAPTDPDLESLIYGFVKSPPADCDCEEELEDVRYVRLNKPSVTLAGGETEDVRAEFVWGGELEVADKWLVSRPDPEVTEVPEPSPVFLSSFTNIRLTAKDEIIPYARWSSGLKPILFT